MKNYLKYHPWQIIEEGFHADRNEISESCFSIGNGRMGQRANFEERFSGDGMQGNYIAGVYYAGEIKTTGFKNDYPRYQAKVLNAPNWIGIDILIDGEVLDLATCRIRSFRRVLNMQEGYLERSFTVKLVSGKELKVKATRFCSFDKKEIGAIRYSIIPLNFEGNITISPYLDAEVTNREDNGKEEYWMPVGRMIKKRSGYLVTETLGTGFRVCVGMKFSIFLNKEKLVFDTIRHQDLKYLACSAEIRCKPNDVVTVYKYAGVVSSNYHPKDGLMNYCQEIVRKAYTMGFNKLLKAHTATWAEKWKEADIVIEGDVAAQQGIRFCIYQLYQSYSGEDERLNISPKGFTGEKYGGSAYWDTEAYCLPFFLGTGDQKIARNLLIYRYKHLKKAIENAAMLGFKNGAALYPMRTITGEECHSEWEITFGEIHRNGAIAYAIYDYVRYTADREYLAKYGLEVLVAISRFWEQRVHFSVPKQQYVIHGVNGPNDYENNVNNNWYTNFIAAWCLRYTLEVAEYLKLSAPVRYAKLAKKLKFNLEVSANKWNDIIQHLYFPIDEERGIFLQQEGFLDKELHNVDTLKTEELPLNQHWSWDRILRSAFIKQADVLQGLYFFEDQFDEVTIRRNFDFYEPMTVHESSLSPCIHAVLAARLGEYDKAYEMFMRTARLDLDDYNNDTENGLHITSMAGTWMAFVEGFGGMRTEADMLCFDPSLPTGWKSYSFKIQWRGVILEVKMDENGPQIVNLSGGSVRIKLKGQVIAV